MKGNAIVPPTARLVKRFRQLFFGFFPTANFSPISNDFRGDCGVHGNGGYHSILGRFFRKFDPSNPLWGVGCVRCYGYIKLNSRVRACGGRERLPPTCLPPQERKAVAIGPRTATLRVFAGRSHALTEGAAPRPTRKNGGTLTGVSGRELSTARA